MRLKLRQTKSKTWYIPSLSHKELMELANHKNRKWSLSQDGLNIILEGY